MPLLSILITAGIILVALVILGLILTRLYRRASKEVSFVRTGFGGEKVIVNGGAIVLPVLHEIIPVNMNTLRLEVRRSSEQALITRDRMRVDVTAEFYVRVKPSAESIATAAQTLGMKTMSPQDLKDLVEGKFVDSLRAVAAEMAMEELHEKRVDFVQKVQQVVSEDLFKNGLELETVSLTGLDQTSFEYFNPQNAFDAEGLTRLTETIEVRRKKRNDIEQDTDLAIKTKNLEAERTRLQILREEEYAKLEQEREIEIRKAEQEREIAVRRAEQAAETASQEAAKQREAEEAQIAAKREVDLKKIIAERDIENERIQKAQITERAEVERKKAIELAEQDRAIAVAEKSRAESEAKALADQARANAIREEENVITVRETERAERAKQVELIAATESAQREAIAVTIAAEAEKQASQDKAEAVRIEAQAAAEKLRLQAQGEADAQILLAQAKERQYQVDAQGTRAVNEAANILSAEQVAMQIRLALLTHLPGIIRESVKPMENIDDIKIVQVGGLAGFGGASSIASETATADNSSLADQMVNSALRYRGQAPLIDSLLKEIGLNGADINGMTSALNITTDNKIDN